jgi:hypothetical protein
MPLLASGNTVYPADVAKVLISIPDELLARLDSLARSVGETRSGFLQRLAEREVLADQASRRKELEELLTPGGHFGGEGTAIIRRERDHRDDRIGRRNPSDA